EGLASVQGKVSQLAYYETFFDDPDRIQTELRQLRALKKEDVLRVFNTYVKDKPAIVQSVVPESDPNGQAQPDNFEIPPRLPRTASATDELQPRPVHEELDRSQRPQSGPAPLVEVPAFEITRFDNGAELISTYSDEVPLVAVHLLFEGGHLLDEPEKFG